MDIIFGPSSLSQHQDHRLIGQAIDDIMLEKTIFFYEDIRSGQNEKIRIFHIFEPNFASFWSYEFI